MAKFFSWLGGVFASLIQGIINFLVEVASWFLDLIIWLVKGIVFLVFAFIKFFANLLPDMPTLPHVDLSTITTILNSADWFFPMSTIFFWLKIVIAVYIAMYVYKLVKLIRGGG